MFRLEKRSSIIYVILGLISVLFLVMILTMYTIANHPTLWDAFVTYGVSGAVFVALSLAPLIGILTSGWYKKYTTQALSNFAADNGFLSTDITDMHTWAGAIFSPNNSRLWPLITGNYANQHFWLGNYTKAASRSSNKVERWGVIRIELPRNLPNILLDSRANNIFGRYISNLPNTYAGYQKYPLEGDFNNYFTVYAPQGYERDMLYFLTPELMAAFVDDSANFDIEIIDSYLYLYSSKPFDFTAKALQPLFKLIQTLGVETADNTSRYQDDRTVSSPAIVSPIDSQAEKGTILPQGRRLKTGWTIGTIVTVIVLAWLAFSYVYDYFYP